jgi:hypothetical protein
VGRQCIAVGYRLPYLSLAAVRLSVAAFVMSVKTYGTPEVTKEHDFLFDLRGFLLLENALRPEDVAQPVPHGPSVRKVLNLSKNIGKNKEYQYIYI